MSHNSRIRAAGLWTLNSVVTPAEFEALDLAQFECINGDQGGVWAPLTEIEIAGQGLKVNGAPFSALSSVVNFSGTDFTVASDDIDFSGSSFDVVVTGQLGLDSTILDIECTVLGGDLGTVAVDTASVTFINDGTNTFSVSNYDTFRVTADAVDLVVAGSFDCDAVGVNFDGTAEFIIESTHTRVDVKPYTRMLGIVSFHERLTPLDNGHLAMRHVALADVAAQTMSVATDGQFFTMDPISQFSTLTLANASPGDFCWVKLLASGNQLLVRRADAVGLITLNVTDTTPSWAMFVVSSDTNQWVVMAEGDRRNP